MNKEKNICSFLVENKQELNINGIEMDDLIVALLIFYDENI